MDYGKQKIKYMKLSKMSRYWIATVALAFISIISFFQINSYLADKHHLNWLFISVGIIMALGAIYCLRQANELQDY